MDKKQTSIVFDQKNLLHSPKVIESFISRITAGLFGRRERRAEPRFPLAVVVDAQFLDENLQPTGSSFQAVTRDISNSGIGITHNQALESRFLAVQLWSPEGDRLQTIVEVLRSEPVGSLYDIGGRFVTAAEIAQQQ